MKRAIPIHALCLLVFLAGLWGPAGAEPAGDRILDDVRISERGECAVIRVSFHFPVRYQRHFPEKSGEELRVKLLPIAINPDDLEALFRRESFRPPGSEIAPLSEVVYEGDISGGPFLTLRFRHPVQFRVGQGDDYRSLRIAVPLPESSSPCLPVEGAGRRKP